MQALAYSMLAGAPYIIVRGTDNVIVSCPPGKFLDLTQRPAACMVCPPGTTSPGAHLG